MTAQISSLPCYADGRPYLTPGPRQPGPFNLITAPVSVVTLSSDHTWPQLWQLAYRHLKRHHFQPDSILLYRQVLRGFSRFVGCGPAHITRDHLTLYLRHLAKQHVSACWRAQALSVLRTVFDKFLGWNIATRMPGPRLPDPLPHILNQDEIETLLHAATTLRDRLLLSLLYGNGLRVGEVCHIRWRDIDLQHETLTIPARANKRERLLPVPRTLLPWLREGAVHCDPDAHLFPGTTDDQPITSRRVQQIVHAAASAAGILKPVSPATLRHSFAVHSLMADVPVHLLQALLGHRWLKTTLRYLRCLPPANAVSPLSVLLPPADPPPSVAFSPPPDGLIDRLEPTSLLRALFCSLRGSTDFCSLLRNRLGNRLFGARSAHPPLPP